ncbi:hypothetical protein TVAG_139630 [Trichomonas vaginalis G3]|uniref:receptor protein-tyrosine kinase n=1 Tax=Trichomonas vaginalis (strain ATCC PRA-98 / G3) TaxID=412133 RepID=A2EJ30_TRIV3|nr:glycine-rich protein family [Trichomonas vaginalis G3]EAY07333.1 hypothetical protein TVAG_139630 [Trichomonas vaginalis G3]KAI5524506.1 glycine-rich protein family [Trichomonas vaginalis G3]|eukprot:XP_001319556.1 hypothetical protein [Trichomonas vaginalis G3]
MSTYGKNTKHLFHVVNKSLGTNSITYYYGGRRAIFKDPCQGSDCTPYMGLFTPGEYKIELWGAGSGFPEHSYGSYGAYVRGTISISTPSVFYIYLGQRGTTSTNLTFNGGTPGLSYYSITSGGGASDIRLVPGNWNSFESLKSRIMVAGAGGGCADHQGGTITGSGGGIKGEDGVFTINSPCLVNDCENQTQRRCYNTIPTGGEQTQSGVDAIYTLRTGKFGIGGYSNQNYLKSPGGAGYYGGGCGASSNCVVSCRAGGSSFVSGMKDCNAISESSSGFDNILHTNQPIHYSGYQFTDTVMLNGGDPEIPKPQNLNFYDGACQITILSDFLSFLQSCQVPYYNYQYFFLSFFIFTDT